MPSLLDILDTGFVFVGLNKSSTHGDQTEGGTLAWRNFHSSYSHQHDFKLRYALTNTKYWGSYITDLIKLYWEVDSSKAKKLLSHHPEIVSKNVFYLEEEISHLQANPVLVAIGAETYKLLHKHLGNKYRIAQIRHYSYYISKEKYREEVLEILDRY